MKPAHYIVIILAVSASLIFVLLRNSSLKSENEALGRDNQLLSKYAAATKRQFGLSIAKNNCWNCHRFHKATDNMLQGVVERIGAKYLKIFITKQDSLVQAKDKYAVALKEAYGNMGNSHNFEFNDKELDALIEFMKD